MNKQKEIHFYENEHEASLNTLKPLMQQKTFYYGYYDTEQAIYDNINIIHTLQMCCLDTSLFKLGYRVFIHENEESVYEIKLGTENERTNREIRISHNLFKMWLNGEFN